MEKGKVPPWECYTTSLRPYSRKSSTSPGSSRKEKPHRTRNLVNSPVITRRQRSESRRWLVWPKRGIVLQVLGCYRKCETGRYRKVSKCEAKVYLVTKNVDDLVQSIIWYQQSYGVKQVCTSYPHYLMWTQVWPIVERGRLDRDTRKMLCLPRNVWKKRLRIATY